MMTCARVAIKVPHRISSADVEAYLAEARPPPASVIRGSCRSMMSVAIPLASAILSRNRRGTDQRRA